MKSETLPIRNAAQESIVPLEWKIGELILNTYEVRDIFTGGGMAYVYRVYHRGWGIDMAVKSPRPEMMSFEDSAENFVREAETWVNLGLHPHVVSCYYVRTLGGIPRIFMEYANGGSLQDGIDQGWLYKGTRIEVLKRMLDIAIQFAWGLHFAHEKELIHQDIKPANLLLTSDGIAKVTDFGIAQARVKSMAGNKMLISLDAGLEGKSILVDTLGLTPAYCSPEQAAARSLSRRTDIWSWAVSILEMFAGKKTWTSGPLALEGLDTYLLWGSIQSIIPPMPGTLASLLKFCFASDPEKRPRDMHMVADELRAIYKREIGQEYPRSEPKVETILADTLNNRAVSMVDLGRDEEALHSFDEAIKTESSHTTALYNRGLFLWRKSKLTDQEVVSVLKENQKNDLKSWEPAYFLGLIHLERGAFSEALEIARDSLAVHGEVKPLQNLLQMAEANPTTTGGAIKTISGMDTVVNSLAVAPNGSYMVSGGNDGSVRVWEIGSGKCVRVMTGHTHLVRVVRLTPDGRHALSGGWDETLRLWDLATGSCERVFEGHSDFVQDLAITSDGKRAISASADCTLRLWDLESGVCLQIFHGHNDTVWSVAFSPDEKTLVSTSFDNTIKIWNVLDGSCTQSFEWMRSCTSNICLSRDGKSVLLAAGDHRLWLIDLADGNPIRSFTGHAGGINTVQIAPNGLWAFSGGMDGSVRLWELQSGRCLRTYSGHTSSVNSIAVCNGKMLAVSASGDQTIRIWLISPGSKAPYATVLPRSSQEMVELSSQVDNDLKAAETLISEGSYSEALEIVGRVRASPENQQNSRLLGLWDQIGCKGIRQGLEAHWLLQSFQAHTARINSIELSKNAKLAFSGSNDKTVGVWRIEDGARQLNLAGHTDAVNAVSLDPQEQKLLSASTDGTLRLWNLETSECLQVLRGHTSEINSATISLDGNLGISGSNDQTVRVWDLRDGKCLKVLKGHDHYVRKAVFTPDGRRAVSMSWDKTLRIWDIFSGEELTQLSGHSEVIEALAITPDGRLAASGGNDHTLRIWNLKAEKAQLIIEGISRRTEALVFSPDGHFLFSAQEDGTILGWDVATGVCIVTIRAHSQPVTGLDISPDGCILASVSSGRLIKLWRLDWKYAIPAKMGLDDGLHSLLEIFLDLHKPYGGDGLVRSGKPVWNQAEFQDLMRSLEHRGYGSIPANEIEAILKVFLR